MLGQQTRQGSAMQINATQWGTNPRFAMFYDAATANDTTPAGVELDIQLTNGSPEILPDVTAQALRDWKLNLKGNGRFADYVNLEDHCIIATTSSSCQSLGGLPRAPVSSNSCCAAPWCSCTRRRSVNSGTASSNLGSTWCSSHRRVANLPCKSTGLKPTRMRRPESHATVASWPCVTCTPLHWTCGGGAVLCAVQ